MKHKYTKPALKFVHIELNDLCVGSRPAVMSVRLKEITQKEKFKRSYMENETNGMWESNF